MEIRIQGADATPDPLADLCREVGHQWPPRHQAEAVSILTKANFPSERIEPFLAMTFKNVAGDELPQHWHSTRGDDWPIFTTMLVEGLRKYLRDTGGNSDEGDDSRSWLRITDVAKILDENRGSVSRLITQGELRDNGKSNQDRRVDAGSVLEYAERSGITLNET